MKPAHRGWLVSGVLMGSGAISLITSSPRFGLSDVIAWTAFASGALMGSVLYERGKEDTAERC